VNDRDANAVAFADRYPNLADVKAIVAAATPALRQDLALRLSAGGFTLAALAQDPEELRSSLFAQTESWVLTGGAAEIARPFFLTALQAEAPVLGLISGDRSSLRAILSRGAAGVLGFSSNPEAMRAAAAAIGEGLAVWEPDEEHEEAPGAAPAPLSPRELEILQRVAAGLPNKVIARQLSLSPNTVKFHLQEAFDKLGVNSRAEAVATAIRRGELAV